jgi:hypothetical protein
VGTNFSKGAAAGSLSAGALGADQETHMANPTAASNLQRRNNGDLFMDTSKSARE